MTRDPAGQARPARDRATPTSARSSPAPICWSFCQANAAQWENAVSLAVKDTVREGSQSLLRVVELLLASERPGAKDAGEALEVIRDFGLARLGFGNGETAVAQAQVPVTTIRMPGLSLPEPSGRARHIHPRGACLRRNAFTRRGVRAAS